LAGCTPAQEWDEALVDESVVAVSGTAGDWELVDGADDGSAGRAAACAVVVGPVVAGTVGGGGAVIVAVVRVAVGGEVVVAASLICGGAAEGAGDGPAVAADPSLSLLPSGFRRSLSGCAFLTAIRSPWLSGSLGSWTGFGGGGFGTGPGGGGGGGVGGG